MPDWGAAGRIYQNPLKTNEIYFNFGPGDEGHIYPAYEPWMEAQGVSEADYERLVREVKRHFDEKKQNNCAFLASACLCCCTAGVLCCPLCFLIKKELSSDEELRKLVERISSSKMTMGEDGCLENAPAIPWLDSKGNPLVFDNPTAFSGTQQENAVPWGYSLLLQASPMPWPPNAPAGVVESAGPAGYVPGAAPTVIGAPVAPAGVVTVPCVVVPSTVVAAPVVVAATPVQQTMAAEDNPDLAENSPNLAENNPDLAENNPNLAAQPF